MACAPALAGCGAGAETPVPLPAGNRIAGDRLTVYVAVPSEGASAVSGRAVVAGAARVLSADGGRIGRYRVTLATVDDASAAAAEWNAPAAGAAATAAAANPTTIGYIGDFNSGASAVSIPILNRLGIAQVSATSTAVGLTSDGIGSSPGEPQAYYPTTRRTFARTVPSDYVQAQAQVTLQRQQGCHATYVLDDGEYDGEAVAQAFDAVAAKRGLDVVATQSYVPTASSYVAVGQTIAGSGADCVLFAAIADRNAVALTTQVAAEVPRDQLFGTMGLAESTFVDPAVGGVPADVGSRLLITASGDGPQPFTVGGYDAMRLMLAAIREATDGGRRQAQRVRVVAAIFSRREREGSLGPYRITADGDTTLDGYGVYRVVRGQLDFWRTIAG